MPTFTKARNVELSVVDAIETAVNASWTGITVVKSFLQSYAVPVPVICVRMLSIESKRREIGGNSLRERYTFVVDIFAKSDGQRIDLTDFIVNAVKNGFVYNEFSHASGGTFTKTANGRIPFLTFEGNTSIEANDSEVEHERYRQSIDFIVEKS